MQKHKTPLIIAASIVSLLVAGLVLAQPQGGQRGQRGQGPRDPEEFRRMMEERIAERMKEQLEITDAEWKVLQPRLRKVMELNAETSGGPGRGGMMGMMFGRGRGGQRGPGGPDGQGDQQRRPRPGGDRPQTEVQQAAEALRETLQSENPGTEDIKAKLTALRSAREKAKQELVKAQQDLRQLLTLKQEATLVMTGMLP
jgi:Spy/CpxP family protein refolding chaperone